MFVNATRDTYSIQQGISFLPGSNLKANVTMLLERSSFNIANGLKNSLFISSCATILTVYFSTLTAYGIFVYDFKFKNAAFTFIMAVLMIPTQVSAVGFLAFMMDIGLMNTFIPLIVPAIAAPAVVFFMRQYMVATMPLQIIEAARIDGSSEFATFNKIALPIMKPAIATQAIFAFIVSWNSLFMPSMLLNTQDKSTLPMMVELLKSDRYRTEYGTVYLGLALTILPMFIVYIILSKYIIQGVALGGVKE
jgi:multiple sugar transport system permease protein